MENIVLVGALVLVPVLAVIAWQYLINRWTISDRLHDIPAEERSVDLASGSRLFGVRGWLYRAGYRRQAAPSIFWSSTACCLLLGISIWYLLQRNGTIFMATDFVQSIPGGVGNVMVPFVLATPWFFIAFLTLIPTLVVRSVRRRRVQKVEQDLPLLLDLLNTLSQAGVGFDAALDRILSAQDQLRPLVMELRLFQADNLAGRSRLESLRRLMYRIEVPMFSTFISAVVQAEQVGAGVAETLRIQATEMRSRRREKASAAAMAVPTMLVVPMVIGFLPGIFIVLIGPMVYAAFGALGQTLGGAPGQ